jgi:hypothetical protein
MDSFILIDSDISTDTESSDSEQEEVFNMPEMNKLINRTVEKFLFNKINFNDINISKDILFDIHDSTLLDSTVLY